MIADDTDDNVSGRKFRAAQPGMPQLTGDRGLRKVRYYPRYLLVGYSPLINAIS